MVRRLFASLVVLACLLGILQPAIACAAACASQTDCCPAGSPARSGEQLHAPSFDAQVLSCCELRPAIATSVSAIDARNDQGHAAGSPAAIAPSALIRLGRPPHQLGAPAAQIPDYPDQSLTYLRTARLRL
jgi:hypothetical protein